MNREHAQQALAHMEKQVPKVHEIAARIAIHLRRMEKTSKNRTWYMANSWPAGPWVGIKYVSYQYTYKLRKADAWHYLQWLDAGNEGRHTAALEALAKVEG